MILRYFIVILFLGGLYNPMLAQEEEEIDSSLYYWVEEYDIPKYSVGLTFSSITNPWPGLQLSHDYRLSERFVLGAETGYLFSSAFNGRGFRIKPSIEYLFYRDNIWGFFVGAAVSSANIWEQFYFTLEYENAYFREVTVKRNRNLIGLYGTFGIKVNLYKGTFLELSGGLGKAWLYNGTLPGNENNQLWLFSVYPTENGWNELLGLYYNFNLSFPIVR